MTERPFTFTSCVVIPMQENSRIAFEGTETLYFPSRSVAAPTVAPFCMTLAPITGAPDPSLTVPVTEIVFCAYDSTPARNRHSVVRIVENTLFILLFIKWLFSFAELVFRKCSIFGSPCECEHQIDIVFTLVRIPAGQKAYRKCIVFQEFVPGIIQTVLI